MTKMRKVRKVLTGLACGVALAAFAGTAQAADPLGPVTMLSSSTATNTAAFDVSGRYYHNIHFLSACTNGATNLTWYVEAAAFKPLYSTNWVKISTNTLATNTASMVSFSGAYKFLRVTVAPVSNVGTNSLYYYGQ